MASKARTIGAVGFDPDAFFDIWNKEQLVLENNFKSSFIKTFDLPQNDTYVYHAIASVTLDQVQQAVDHGGEALLHAWYRDLDGKSVWSTETQS